jgi:addiction module HigA family antidote
LQKGYAMTEIAAPRRERAPTHPGELLREDAIPATGLPKAEIARLLGISRQHLYAIMNEVKPISPDVAVRLGKLFGNGPDLWVRMQSAFDTWHAARSVDISAIPTIEASNENGSRGRYLARA